jgi:CBS domain-containing protein
VLDAARLMNTHRVGCVVVTDGGSMVGILTERDILTRIVAVQRDPAATCVAEVMTAPVLTCGPETPVNEARRAMRDRRVRHLPVARGDSIVGMLSIGDLNLVEQETLSQTIRYMEAYIAGGVV